MPAGRDLMIRHLESENRPRLERGFALTDLSSMVTEARCLRIESKFDAVLFGSPHPALPKAAIWGDISRQKRLRSKQARARGADESYVRLWCHGRLFCALYSVPVRLSQ